MSNPFADPFSDPSVTNASSQYNPIEASGSATYGTVPNTSSSEAKASSKAVYSNISAPPSMLNEESLAIREQTLILREQKLLEREQALDKRQKELEKYGGIPNWPSECYPLVYHDIQKEIPADSRTFVRKFYASLLFTWLCLFWNWIVILSVWFEDSSEGYTSFWATIFILCGIPGAWKFWYRSIYYAIRDNSSRNWVFFFFFFFCHIGFSIVMGLGVPSTSGAGLFYMMKLFSRSYNIQGICCLVSTICWGLNVFFCIALIKLAYTEWKRSGADRQTAQDATKAVMETQLKQTNYAQLNERNDEENI